MLPLILGWLLKFMGSQAFGAIGTYLSKLSDNKAAQFIAQTGAERDIAVSQLQTSAAVYHDTATLAQQRWGSKWMQLLVFLAAIGPIGHFAAVYFVSMFPFLHLTVARLPEAYATQEFNVIAAIIGYSAGLTGMNLIGRIFKK